MAGSGSPIRPSSGKESVWLLVAIVVALAVIGGWSLTHPTTQRPPNTLAAHVPLTR
ncbi:MAG: hypothetical protein JWO84_56 [Parcubacteria group bacterium]|nr:hypothetical protein [Parcubacteria group bacterium]